MSGSLASTQLAVETDPQLLLCIHCLLDMEAKEAGALL